MRQPYSESLVFPEVFIQFSQKEKTFLAQFCNEEAFTFFFILAPLNQQISRKFAISMKEDYFQKECYQVRRASESPYKFKRYSSESNLSLVCFPFHLICNNNSRQNVFVILIFLFCVLLSWNKTLPLKQISSFDLRY